MSTTSAPPASLTPPPGGARIPVAVLGATGAVGQSFVRLLQNHPWFDLVAVAASERSAGRSYREATRWLEGPMPDATAELVVQPCDPAAVEGALVFSALDASVAGAAEQAFARDGRVVLSNARNHRMDPDVPLVIPEVNAGHLDVIEAQRARRGWSGAIVTNGNCAAIVVVMALAPLHAAFGVRSLFVTTLQAVSGAGYPGVPSLDILGNIVPIIGGGEEEKIETETRKMLGALDRSSGGGMLVDASIAISAQVTRVPVEHGHTVCLSVGFDRRVSPDEALAELRAWRPDTHGLGLPSAPEPALYITDAEDRPQPRRDANAGGGMAVTVGRVRRDPILDLRLVACGHNLVRGAAGASVLNAELLAARGLVRR